MWWALSLFNNGFYIFYKFTPESVCERTFENWTLLFDEVISKNFVSSFYGTWCKQVLERLNQSGF